MFTLHKFKSKTEMNFLLILNVMFLQGKGYAEKSKTTEGVRREEKVGNP